MSFKSKKSLLHLAILSLSCSALLLCSTQTLAKKRVRKPRRFPRGCRVMGYQFEQNDLVLTPVTEETPQTLYLFHNIGQNNIRLVYKHDPKDITSAKYQSKINQNRWTSFAVDKKQMVFACYDKSDYDDSDVAINCQTYLDVCQYNRAKFAQHNMGTYWVSENKSLKAVLYDSIRKIGILLRS